MSESWRSDEGPRSARPTDLLRVDSAGHLTKNAPSMPVRYNRRSTMKKLSDLNDHNLPLVRKNLLGSEHSFAIKGQIDAENRKLKKTILTWYRTLNWRVKRCTRIQDEYYRMLQKYHVAQRQCSRRNQQQLEMSHESTMSDMSDGLDAPFDIRRTQSDLEPNILRVDPPSGPNTGSSTTSRRMSVAQRERELEEEENRLPFFVRDRQLSDPSVNSSLKPESLATLQAFLQFMNSTDDVPDTGNNGPRRKPSYPSAPAQSAPAMSIKRRMSNVFRPNLPTLEEFRDKEHAGAADAANRAEAEGGATLRLKSEVVARRKLSRPQDALLVKALPNALPVNPPDNSSALSANNLNDTSSSMSAALHTTNVVNNTNGPSSPSKESSSVSGREGEGTTPPLGNGNGTGTKPNGRRMSMVDVVREGRLKKELEFRKVVDSSFTAYKRQGMFSLYELRSHPVAGAPPEPQHQTRAEIARRAQNERLFGPEHDPDLVPIESAPKAYNREFPSNRDVYHRERLLRRERSRGLELIVNSSEFFRGERAAEPQGAKGGTFQ